MMENRSVHLDSCSQAAVHIQPSLPVQGEDEVKKPWNPMVSVAYLYKNGYNKGHIRHVFFTI